MVEAVRTSETSVDNYFTRQYIPEDNSELLKDTVKHLESFLDSQLNFHHNVDLISSQIMKLLGLTRVTTFTLEL
jgi:hypothetical protein